VSGFLRSIFTPSRRDRSAIQRIKAQRARFTHLTDDELRSVAQTGDLIPLMAATAEIAARVLGENMFDVQFRGALALTRGSIAEMQTGEGKTLAAVPAVAWYARHGGGVHVMTANDYLARRDAAWMGDIYRFLGLSVGFLQQRMTAEERRGAYACDVLYATPNEIGFDFLRDRLAFHRHQQVQRAFEAAEKGDGPLCPPSDSPRKSTSCRWGQRSLSPFSAASFACAVIDEVDSILIDEARIPLVIAGGDADDTSLAQAAEQIIRAFRVPFHCTVDAGARNVALTDAGIMAVESAFASGNLYEERNLRLLTAVQDSLHAHILLRRDVDYVVKNGAVEMVDEFKGRIALDRRWPAGLHTAIEAKEGVSAKRQGTILGSITLQHLIALYPRICGMTGTAATQALEFEKIYGLPVETIPTNRPVIRVDHPDGVFDTRRAKEDAVLEEIRRVHATGRPILAGTGSIEESERLSALLAGIPHRVLNARQDEREAAIIAQAGERAAVTISTNMAGRGTDIRLGQGVVELGGLHVIGTNKHESRRIDNQLRGRAGRQGDPGSSRFFVSLEDDLMIKYGDLNPGLGKDPATVQRLVEGQNLDTRLLLQRYELPIEGQRHRIHSRRQEILDGAVACASELERLITLRTIDDLWADYLARVAELRSGLPWLNFGRAGLPWLTLDRRDGQYEFAQKIHQWFPEMEAELPVEIARRVAEPQASGGSSCAERGAVWTYLTTDQPLGTLGQRFSRGLRALRRS
jgi:preprotein translocase subunit SecA